MHVEKPTRLIGKAAGRSICPEIPEISMGTYFVLAAAYAGRRSELRTERSFCTEQARKFIFLKHRSFLWSKNRFDVLFRESPDLEFRLRCTPCCTFPAWKAYEAHPNDTEVGTKGIRKEIQ
jgi:hypothetical protein